MRVMRLLAGAAGLAFFCASAHAQEAPSEDGPYFRIAAGASFVSSMDREFAYNPDLVFLTPPASGQGVDNGAGYLLGAALGFDYADGIRTELEYRYAVTEVSSVTELGGPSDGAVAMPSEDMKAQFVLSNFYFDFANSSALTPFIGGGVGGAFVKDEMGRRDAVLAWQARAGISLGLGESLSADVEYIFLRTNELDFGPNPEDFTPAGPFETAVFGDHYQSSSVMASFRKRF